MHKIKAATIGWYTNAYIGYTVIFSFRALYRTILWFISQKHIMHWHGKRHTSMRYVRVIRWSSYPPTTRRDTLTYNLLIEKDLCICRLSVCTHNISETCQMWFQTLSKCLPLLHWVRNFTIFLSTGWFQEQIRVSFKKKTPHNCFFLNRAKINRNVLILNSVMYNISIFVRSLLRNGKMTQENNALTSLKLKLSTEWLSHLGTTTMPKSTTNQSVSFMIMSQH